MRLSRRTQWPAGVDAWTAAVERARADGGVLDLSESNPTAVGLRHADEVYAGLGEPADARYEPAALGMRVAREAVAEHYARRGRAVDPERVWLYASTSDAYAQLMTLLGDPGDAVLVPRPGYPLFDLLGDATGLRRVAYPLRYDGRWYVDLAGLDEALRDEARPRAIVVVAPSNPTGHVPDAAQWRGLEQRAREHGLPLLLDEVFADYPLDGETSRPELADDVVVLVLSGLSKVAALPQLKLGWVVAHGPDQAVAELRRRAELLADTFLGVSTPVQRAAPRLLLTAEEIQPRIRARLRQNLVMLDEAIRGRAIDRLHADGGWTALLRLPTLDGYDDLRWSLDLLGRGVIVQPGYLFDLPPPPRVAVSLLTPPERFAQGVARLVAAVEELVEA